MTKFRKSVIAIVLTLALVLPGAAFAADMDMKDAEMMDTEMKDTEMKDMDMKDSEMMDTEMKDMDMIEMDNMSDAYMGVGMMSKNGMEYVELRQLAMNLGYVIEWNGMTKTVTLTTTAKNDMMKDMMSKYIIELEVGSMMSIMVNGEMQDTSEKPMIISGRTFVTKAFADMYIVKMMK
jgi:hypothetical protein